jgi:hypothetical protein
LAKEKKTTSVPPDNLRLYEELVARPPGATSPPNKEYAAAPDDLLKDTAQLRPYLEASYQYARSLRSKATAKKKA